MDRLRVSLSIWGDVLSSKDEIDGWSNSSVPQLADSISNLNNSVKAEEFLKEFEVDWVRLQMWACELIDQKRKKTCVLFLKFSLSFRDTSECYKILNYLLLLTWKLNRQWIRLSAHFCHVLGSKVLVERWKLIKSVFVSVLSENMAPSFFKSKWKVFVI